MGAKDEQDWANQAAKNEFEWTSTDRIISMGNYGAKSDKLIKTLIKTVDKAPSLPTEKINQLSSVMDQMSKIINDILK